MPIEYLLFILAIGCLFVNVFMPVKFVFPLIAMFLGIGSLMTPEINTWLEYADIILIIACFLWALGAFYGEVIKQ